MIRILLRLGLFALPFLAYFLWAGFVRRRQAQGPFDDAPYVKMALAGLALVLLSFLALRVEKDQPQKGAYIPPHLDAAGHVVGPAYAPAQ